MTKHAGGRPTKLTDEILSKAYEYIDQAVDSHEVVGENRPTVVWHVKLPSIEGLANYIDISKETLYQWEKENVGFSDVLTRVRNLQAERLINNSLAGNYNPMISRLLLTKHGYVEKSEQDLNHSGDVTFTNGVPRPGNRS
jgi:hypothetical protein